MFWLKFGIITLILLLLISGMKFFLRKAFKIEKEKKAFFSYNYINELHKKVDWCVRIGSMIVFIVVIYLVIFNGFPITLYLVFLVLLTIAEYTMRAIFEWKYSENPKQAILTFSEMSVLVTAFILIF